MKPSRGIADNHICVPGFRRRDRVEHHCGWVGAFALFYQVGAGTVCPDRQLVDGCRPERIRRRASRPFPFPGQTGGNFTDGGGFPTPLTPITRIMEGLVAKSEGWYLLPAFPLPRYEASHDLVRVFYAVALYSGFQFLTNALEPY